MNLLRSHCFAFCAMAVFMLAAVGACAFTGNLGGKQQSASQIVQSDAVKQAEFQTQQAQLAATQSNINAAASQAASDLTAATNPADLATAKAAAAKAAADARALTAQVAALQASQNAWNAQTSAALQEIAQKQSSAQAVVQTLGGVATAAEKGATDPSSLIASGVTLLSLLLGGGAMADSLRKSQTIAKLQTPAASAN